MCLNYGALLMVGPPSDVNDQVTVFLFEMDCLIDLIIFSKKEGRFIWIKKK